MSCRGVVVKVSALTTTINRFESRQPNLNQRYTVSEAAVRQCAHSSRPNWGLNRYTQWTGLSLQYARSEIHMRTVECHECRVANVWWQRLSEG